MAHNNNVGKLNEGATANISIKGSGSLDTTSDTGSILGLRYIKDNKLGTGSITTTPVDIDSRSLKNWFATYVKDRGNYDRKTGDNQDIKWSDYRGATILGFKVRAKNESEDQTYKDNDDAALQIQPLNGGLGNYTVKVGNITKTSTGGAQVQIGVITDLTTNVSINMNWDPGYHNNASLIRGSQNVGSPGQGFNFSWTSSPRGTNYSSYLFFFMGIEDTRLYGSLYT